MAESSLNQSAGAHVAILDEDEQGGRPVALAYRALNLGDLLTAVPALRGLRRALPRHRLVLATKPGLRPLIPLIGAVDELLPADELCPLRWPWPGPDVAVDLHGRGPESHRVLLGIEPRRLVAFAAPEVAVEGPPWRPGEHEVRRWCRLVEWAWPGSAFTHDLALLRPATPAAVPGAVIVHPGAAAPARRWPVERFAEVARFLARTGRPVLITGSAAEVELAEAVRAAADLPRSAVLAGATSLDELAALVADARLLVSNDTGVAHVATAFRTPSVVLFGPTSAAEWGPPPSDRHIALGDGGGGDPHGTVLDPALARIQVDDVVAAAEALLRCSGG
ncbi:glycosyltransferase family 9 protein [Phytoactinopolyspora alkaliphila]|uniref:Glycosyltransferase family 9 protein n=1 Tax=Phytoactinopolyspora alkaliphila TaxID=1783498 RepID=A0A6N9YLH9_9ACTN|nr:glycosyltransferase family 9 protein [Phytoactinopolyspora alkaliphila]NED95931.1 glycosyltransferase family 9 protein [Phytoactinopolyspora alkaliphila]